MSLTYLSTLLRFATGVPLVLIDDINFTWWRYEQWSCDMTSFPEGEIRRQMITLLFLLKYLGYTCLFFFYVNSVTPRKWGNAYNRSLFLQHLILWEFSKNLPKIWVTMRWIGNSESQIMLICQLCYRQLCY